ncbi:MAG: hypothetical protein GXZ11_06670 [Tissierellia bacterium]|nr:hypothetical protein [Tissierellia bacterium]
MKNMVKGILIGIIALACCIIIYSLKETVYNCESLKISTKNAYSIIENIKTGEQIKVNGRIISFDIGDLNGDNMEEVGFVYKKCLSRKTMVEILTLSTNPKLIYSGDLTDVRPWKIVFGDVTGDGVKEIALGFVKETPFHPVAMKRCFFYNIDFNNQKLIPVFRPSRFTRPLIDYYIWDMDGDGISEVLVLEDMNHGNYIIGAYKWMGFGFVLDSESRQFAEKGTFNKGDSEISFNGKILEYQEGKIVIGGEL